MQSASPHDAVQHPRHAPLSSSNGDLSANPPDSFHIKQPSMSGLRDRHGANMPTINTSRAGQALPGPSDMQTPGTGYDMNYTPLLPSQLLMGSPFQPGSPSSFASPGFQSFQNFQPGGQGQQQNQHHTMTSPLQTQQPMSPIFQSMMSPTGMTPTHGFGQAFGPGQQTGGFGAMGNNFGNMPMSPGLASGTSRTVYLGNIPSETSAEEILGHVRSGQIESVRLLPDKNCAFISFVDSSSAVHFHSDAILKKLAIRGQDIKIGWGKPSQVPQSVSLAIQQAGASRNVYLGNLPPETTEDQLREELAKFGPVDTVKLVREKNIGFVHFLSIGNAIKAVTQLPQEPEWGPPRRVYYGKDRCAYVSKTQQQNAAQYLGIAPGYAHVLNSADRDLISNALAQQSVAAAAVATAAGGVNNLGNRTVYLGNIHPETTAEEICNVVRGGLLHHIRYIPDKHICFVTFIDPTAAASFYALSNMQGLMIHNRRLKIGWGKHSGALPAAIALAVSGGASRNVYIGNIDESWTEERLRQDFTEYGEIELVNALREKSCAFVNFTNIANAIKAIEAVRGKEEYKRFKINFGKDRCGNPPRQNNHNHGQMQQQNMQDSQDGMQSPTLNGNLQPGSHESQGGSSAHSTAGISPAPGSMSNQSANQLNQIYQGTSPAATAASANGNNPLNMYLTQMSSQQQQHQQEQQQYGSNSPTHQQASQHNHNGSQQSFYGASSNHSTSSMSRGGLEAPNQPHFGHGSSNSFSISAGGMAPTLGGMLAPSNMNAAQRAQHARAVSLPAFSQGPFGQGPQGQQMQNNAFGGLGAGLGGLAIQGEGGLPRWAEEEVGS